MKINKQTRMDKSSRKNKDLAHKFQEKPTKIPKKPIEETNLKSSMMTEKGDFSEVLQENQKLRQNLKELQSKNIALNTSLAESQVAISNLQVEIAKLEKKMQEFTKEKGRLEESQYISNKVTNDLAKEKQRNKDLVEKIEEMKRKVEKNNNDVGVKFRKILNLIQKAKEISSIVGSLKGRFFDKVDIVGSWKETFKKIEDLIRRDSTFEDEEQDLNNSLAKEDVKGEFLRVFKEFEDENGFLRSKLEEMQEKMRDSKDTLEKYQINFERIRDKFEESKAQNEEIREENEALKRQIEALERKSDNQTEIIEILKLRIKGFEEEINLEEEEEGYEEERDGSEKLIRRTSMESEENDGLEKEIQELDHEIKYIQGILNQNKL